MVRIFFECHNINIVFFFFLNEKLLNKQFFTLNILYQQLQFIFEKFKCILNNFQLIILFNFIISLN